MADDVDDPLFVRIRDAVFSRWLTGNGLAEKWLRERTSGRVEISRAVAREFARILEIPPGDWPWLEAEVRLGAPASARNLPRTQEPMSTRLETHGPAHTRRIEAITSAAHEAEDGRALHPLLAWLGSKSVAKYAVELGIKRGTLQAYVGGTRPIPVTMARRIATESDGAVPASAWARTASK